MQRRKHKYQHDHVDRPRLHVGRKALNFASSTRTQIIDVGLTRLLILVQRVVADDLHSLWRVVARNETQCWILVGSL